MSFAPCKRCRIRRHLNRDGLCFVCRRGLCERCGLDRITDCRCDDVPDDDMARPEDIHPHRPGYLPANGEGR